MQFCSCLAILCSRHTQTKTTQNAVRPRSSNKRNRNLLKFENKSRFPVHTTTKLSFHHVYHVRCRLWLRAGSSTSMTFSLRPQDDHTIRTTTLVRSCHVYIASVPPKTYPAKYSHFCCSVDIFSLKNATQRSR